MSQNLVVNGVTYAFPDVGDQNWGQDVTDWATAVTGGMLQKAGGSFTLTAEVDLGATYGVKSAYLTSRTTNPAAAGVVRLAKTDSVSWRNNANGADLALTIDSSNRLTFGGVVLAPAAALTASRAMVTDGSGVPTVSAVTATELGYVSGVTSAIQTQMDAKAPLASPTFTGTVTAPAIAVTNTTNQIVLGATRTVTITAPTPASSSRTWTIPDLSTSPTFAALEGTQTFSGSKTFSAAITSTLASGNSLVVDTTTLIVDASNHRVGIGTASPISRSHLYVSGTAISTSGSDSAPESLLEGPSHSMGIAGNPTNFSVIANDTLAADIGGGIGFGAKYTGNSYAIMAIIKSGRDNATDGNFGGYLAFGSRQNGSSVAERMRITSGGSVIINTAAIATNATDGFLYIPSCAGTPTGTPTTFTGRLALVYDSTNNKFYVYNGAWKGVTLA